MYNIIKLIDFYRLNKSRNPEPWETLDPSKPQKVRNAVSQTRTVMIMLCIYSLFRLHACRLFTITSDTDRVNTRGDALNTSWDSHVDCKVLSIRLEAQEQFQSITNRWVLSPFSS